MPNVDSEGPRLVAAVPPTGSCKIGRATATSKPPQLLAAASSPHCVRRVLSQSMVVMCWLKMSALAEGSARRIARSCRERGGGSVGGSDSVQLWVAGKLLYVG